MTSNVFRSLNAADLKNRSLAWKAAALVIGTAILGLSSYVEVPMIPVPVTMQTFAVTLIGALYGWRLGAATVAAWLVEGAVGLPVLAGGAAGAHHFVGPTAGYLFAFPVAAALTGWLAERGWNGARPVLAFVSMALGNLLCLAIGASWLAVGIGLDQAIEFGVIPFLIGALLKSALGAATLRVMNGPARPTE
jgi:biotin transport system substrate-specific component